MNLFDIFIFDLIFLIFPLMLYLIYSAYTKTLDFNKNSLYLDLALFSACYLIIRFGVLKIDSIPLLLLDIILMLAYLKNKKISFTILSIIIAFYYMQTLNTPIYLIVMEYIVYYFLYLFFKKQNKYFFVNAFIMVKLCFFVLEVMLNNLIDVDNINILILSVLSYIIISNFIVFLYDKIDDMFILYNQVKNIEKEKQIKTSLFKITHEIKNPIAVCKGYLDMFDINNKKHCQKYIPILKSEINRVLYLLEDFLSITKINIKKEEMDLNMLLEDTIDCLKPILNNKKIDFNYKIDDDEFYINADYNRLKQALVNLIKNSKEAIDGNGKIKLYTKVLKNKVKIFIEDTGKGMNDEELSKIKEAFFTTKKTGTGLGIYLSNEIIKAHNGNLEYHSSKNKGTKVVITLPI